MARGLYLERIKNISLMKDISHKQLTTILHTVITK